MKYKYIRSLIRDELLSEGKIIYGSLNKDCFRQYISKKEIMVVEEGITEIDKHAFLHIHGLKEIYLPSTIEKIKEEAFRNCYDLEKIHCASPLVDVKSKAFFNVKNLSLIDMNMRVANDNINSLFTNSTQTRIPKTLTSYRLAKVEDDKLQIMSYQRDENAKKISFIPESPNPIIKGFNSETREVFELPQ